MKARNIAIILILIIIAAAFAVLVLTSEEAPASKVYEGSSAFLIGYTRAGVLNYGEKNGSYIHFLNLAVSSKYVGSYELEYLWLKTRPLKQVYFLDYERVGMGNFEVFKTSFGGKLAEYGLDARKSSVDEIKRKKDCVIIIASGLMPTPLAENNTLLEMIEANNTVIYMGKGFDLSLSRTGAPEPLGENFSRALGIAYSSKGVELLSSAQGKARMSRENESAVIAYENAGYLIILPELERLKNAEDTADFLAYYIVQNGWQTPLSNRTVRANLSGNFAENYAANVTLFSNRSAENQGYGRVIYRAQMKNGSIGEIKGVLDTVGERVRSGNLLVVSEQVFPAVNYTIAYQFPENYTSTRAVSLKLRTWKNNVLVEEKEAGRIKVKTIGIGSEVIGQNLSAGNYLIELVDDFGKVKGAAMLHVSNLSVNIVDASNTLDRFGFSVKIDGQPAENFEGIIRIDNGSANYRFKTASTGTFAIKTTPLSAGKHVFGVELPGSGYVWRRIYTLGETGVTVSLPMMMLGVGVVILIAVFFLLRRPERNLWSIEHAPEMEEKEEEVKLSFEQLLEIFKRVEEKIDVGESEELMPLTIGDLSRDIGKCCTLDSAPLNVTTTNLSEILEKEVKKGRFVKLHEHYLPKKFLEKSKRGMDYLVSYRLIFDLMIEKGIRNIRAGEPCDFEVERGSQVYFVHIYDAKTAVRNALQLVRKGKNILVLFDEDARSKAKELLLKHKEEYIRLNLEVMYGKIELKTLKEFLAFLEAV
ncbi:MAG: hypothetical protein ABIH99_04690 [Candidatus Micrarchaeota archaeon]